MVEYTAYTRSPTAWLGKSGERVALGNKDIQKHLCTLGNLESHMCPKTRCVLRKEDDMIQLSFLAVYIKKS